MKLFKKEPDKLNTIARPSLFIVAVCLAFSMWYFVVIHETSEAHVKLLINYKGLPKQLYVTSGQIYTVQERIRGPKLLVDKLPENYPLPIDISHIKVGDGYTNTFSVVDEQKKTINPAQLRAFKIIDVNPPIIRLHAEYMDRINIPLSFHYHSDNDLIVVTHKISQNSVSFTGPENEIKILKSMSSLPIDVRVDLLDAGKGQVVKDIPIIIPVKDCPHVTVEPSSIKIAYEVKGERVEVVRSYDISLAVTNTSLYEMVPSQVTLRLKVPANKQRDPQYLKELRVTALPPDMQVGEQKKVLLNFTLPEGMEIMDSNKWISIVRLPDNPAKEKPQELKARPNQELKNEAKPATQHGEEKDKKRRRHRRTDSTKND